MAIMPNALQKQIVVDAFNEGAKLGALDGRFVKLTTNAMQLVGLELARNVDASDRASICVPVNVDVGSKINPGAILLLEDRVVIAWSEGALRPKPRSLTCELSEVSNVVSSKRRVGKISAQLDAVSFTAAEEMIQIILHSEVSHDRLTPVISGALNGAVTFNWEDPTTT
jgi:hypothetical protein